MKPINLGKVSAACDNVACQRNELEALEAIFAEDFSLQAVPPALIDREKGKVPYGNEVSASPTLIGSAGAFGVLAEEEDTSEDISLSPPLSPASLLNAGPPFHVRIYLRPFPANPEANHVAIHLHAVIPYNYPDEVPSISVTNVLGMPKAQVDMLAEQLRALAQQLRGSEMIYQLTEAAMQYLFRHNVPLQQGSLHDQMIDFEKEQKKSEAIGNTTRKDKEKLRQCLKQKQLKAMYEQQLSESERPLQDDEGADSETSVSEVSKEKKRQTKNETGSAKNRLKLHETKAANRQLGKSEEEESEQMESEEDEDVTDDEEEEGDDSADIFQTEHKPRSTSGKTSRGELSEDEGDLSESDGASTIHLPSPPPVEEAAPVRARLSSFREGADPKDMFPKSQLFLSPSPFLTSVSSPGSSVLGAFSSTLATTSTTTTVSSTVSSSVSSSVSSTVPSTVSTVSSTVSSVSSLAKPSTSSVPNIEPNFSSIPTKFPKSNKKQTPRKQSESEEDEGDESEEGVDLLHEFHKPLDMNVLLASKGNSSAKRKLEVSRRKKTDQNTSRSSASKLATTSPSKPLPISTIKPVPNADIPSTKQPISTSAPKRLGQSDSSPESFSESEIEDEGDDDEFDEEDDDYLKDFRSPLDLDFLRTANVKEVPKPATSTSTPTSTTKNEGTSKPSWTSSKQPSPTKSLSPTKLKPLTPQSKTSLENTKLTRASEEEDSQEGDTSEADLLDNSLLEEFSAPLDLDRLRKGVKTEKPPKELAAPVRKEQNKVKPKLVKSKSEADDDDSYSNDEADSEFRTYMGRPAVTDFALRSKPKKSVAPTKWAQRFQESAQREKLAAKSDVAIPAVRGKQEKSKDKNRPPKPKPKVEKAKPQEDEYLDMDESRYRYGMGKGGPRAVLDRHPPFESRYQHDFEEIETLGKGGFGVVVKARNKIDGAYYAIKKMGVDETDKEVLREVVALASLHHHHIVRYYQAWYEPMTPELLKQLPCGEESGSENTYTSGPGGPPNSVLYIQMEFCSGKTLKTFISESKNIDAFTKPRRKKMIWTLFRQMLEALAFIHSKHMLHRDIKPENVFLDSTGSVKLGDFGLAVGDTATKTLPVLQRQSSYITGIMNSHPEQTLEIGTMMYSAPEQMGSRHGGYGPSADIYSLGIVLLEMWQPFGSASEKASCIAELRRTETVPDSCSYFHLKSSKGREARERTRVKFIIESLVKHDPHARPTAEGLLASKMIPVLIDHPHFKTALRALEQPESELRLKILHQLFNLPVEDHVDFTFDHHSYKPGAGLESETLAVLRDFLSRIFRKHGAQWFTPPILVPKTQKVDIARKATVILLDSAGIPVEVCGHPTLSFARWAAKTSATNVRRFEIGRELEATTDVCTAPIEHLVGSFDIVWSPSVEKKCERSEELESVHEDVRLSAKACESRCAFLQAEVIQVASEIAGCLSPVIGPTTIYVNHTRLLETLVELCICVNNEQSDSCFRMYVAKEEEEETEDGIQGKEPGEVAQPKEESEKGYIMRVLREQRNVSRQKLQDQLLNRTKHLLPNARKRYGEVIELLMTFLELKGPLNTTLEQLKEMTYVRMFLNSKKRYEGSSSLRTWICELENLCCALRSFGFDVDTPPGPKEEASERHVILDLGFVPRYTVFQGAVLQVCQNPPSHPLIVGGCYEHLLERFRPPEENHSPQSGMGLSVHIPRLLECCRVRKVDGEALRRLINRDNVCALPEEGERVVLFADKGKMLTERAMLAGELWQRGVKAELQSDFTLRQAVSYCTDHSIRFLVRFRVKTFTERRAVELQVAPFQSQCGVVLSINDVIVQICQEGKSLAPAKPVPTSSRLANMNQDIEVKMVGGAAKTMSVITKIRKKLAPFVAMNPYRCAVVAISLSIILIRGTSHAFLQDRLAETQRSPFFGPTPITPTRTRGKQGSQQLALTTRPSSPKLIGRTGRRGSDSNIIIPERKSEMYFKNFVNQVPKDRAQLVKAYHAFLLSVQGTEFLFTYSLEEDKLDMLALT